MRVLIAGNPHDPLSPAEEKDVRQFGAEESVQGVVLPADRLPSAVRPLVSALPSGALGQGLRDVLLHGQALPLGAVGVLLAWAGVAGWATSRTFRWS